MLQYEIPLEFYFLFSVLHAVAFLFFCWRSCAPCYCSVVWQIE